MRPASLLVLALLGAAMPAAAQQRSVTFLARGGGFNALTDLDDSANPSDFKTGYNVGGAAIVQVNRYLGVRGDFTLPGRSSAKPGWRPRITSTSSSTRARFSWAIPRPAASPRTCSPAAAG